MQYTAFFTLLALMATVNGHMQMSFPPPLRSTFNKLADPSKIDYSMTAPLTGAAQFPCKGYQSDIGTPGGASVVTWNAGAKVNFTIVGGAAHGGGSCQASLSYDSGKTFTVIHSYMGNCPIQTTGNFDLTIPSDAKNGAALFAWTWYNQIGNREIYMNCASITIAGGKKRDAPAVAFSARPGLFVANLANGCSSVEGKDITFPDPGPDVTGTGSGTGSITGTCAAVNGIGGGSSGSSSGGSASAAPAASSAAPSAPASSAPASSAPASSAPAASSAPSSATSVAIIPVTSSAAASSGFATSASPAAASSTASAPAPLGTGTSGSLTVSSNGQCSGSQTCTGQTAFGSCCSQWGFCGSTPLHCGTGCQSAFGTCGTSGTNSTSVKARGYLKGRRPVRVL